MSLQPLDGIPIQSWSIEICWLHCHFNNQFENELDKPTNRRHKHWTLAFALDLIDFEEAKKNWTDLSRNGVHFHSLSQRIFELNRLGQANWKNVQKYRTGCNLFADYWNNLPQTQIRKKLERGLCFRQIEYFREYLSFFISVVVLFVLCDRREACAYFVVCHE